MFPKGTLFTFVYHSGTVLYLLKAAGNSSSVLGIDVDNDDRTSIDFEVGDEWNLSNNIEEDYGHYFQFSGLITFKQ